MVKSFFKEAAENGNPIYSANPSIFWIKHDVSISSDKTSPFNYKISVPYIPNRNRGITNFDCNETETGGEVLTYRESILFSSTTELSNKTTCKYPFEWNITAEKMAIQSMFGKTVEKHCITHDDGKNTVMFCYKKTN